MEYNPNGIIFFINFQYANTNVTTHLVKNIINNLFS